MNWTLIIQLDIIEHELNINWTLIKVIGRSIWHVTPISEVIICTFSCMSEGNTMVWRGGVLNIEQQSGSPWPSPIKKTHGQGIAKWRSIEVWTGLPPVVCEGASNLQRRWGPAGFHWIPRRCTPRQQTKTTMAVSIYSKLATFEAKGQDQPKVGCSISVQLVFN